MASWWSSGGRARSAVTRLRGHAGFWWKALTQPQIDITLRTHTGQLTRIVESPGLSLPEAELEALVAQLRIVAAKTLPAESLTYGIFSGEREKLSRAVVTLISEEATGRPIAFNALAVMPVELDGEPAEVTHLGLVMVDPDERGQGLSWVLYGLTALVLFARDGLRPKWISNVTQVPAVVGMAARRFRMCFHRRIRAPARALRICIWRAASCAVTAPCSASATWPVSTRPVLSLPMPIRADRTR